MTWKIRHEGSPRAIEGLTLSQVVEGLQDGLWEATDEVQGPDDRDWVALENHPQFAEMALDIEPPPAKHYDDETRLDMNPLIDVTLVLLIFFILTTSYAALQKVLDLPSTSSKSLEGPLQVTKEKVQETMIKVEARVVNGKTIIKVEDQEVQPDNLVAALSRFVGSKGKTELLLDASPDVPWGDVVQIQDAARGAGMTKVHYQVRPRVAAPGP
jgi:biopolymer transport protein ExbD